MGIRKGSAGRNGNSPYRSEYTPGSQGNSGSPTRDPSQWRSYSNDPDPMDPSVPAIPKFDIDPDIPLETMAPMKTTSESEQSDSGGNRAHQTGLTHRTPAWRSTSAGRWRERPEWIL